MNKIYKISLAISMMLFSISTFAQKNFFSDISEAQAKSSAGARVIAPQKFRTLALDNVSLKNFLWSLPTEKNVANRKTAPVLELPMPDGRIAKFNVWESSIQEQALEAKFPEIKTFLGQGIDDPYATIRFDYTPRGFHAQVLSVNGSYYIDPFSMETTNNYQSYFRTDLVKNVPFECGVVNVATAGRPDNVEAACLGTQMRTYRLAVACTGEYAQAPGIAAGANAAILHAAIVTSVNRVVGVYEKEVSIRMVLVANNNLVEYLNAGTDPFNGNNNANVLINESQTVIDANIGFANYDIGHTFSTGGGGLAQLNSPCGTSKARGITGSSSPTGDAYDIDYVAHEMGHQFGGNHSMAGCGASPSNTKYEVGSGTTIQAYAGICAAENIQPNSDPHFHAISFDEISNFVFGGGTCGVITATGNTLPVIDPLPNTGLTIPIGTPFTLSGTATDANGDALSYCWEQWDFSGTATWNAGATAAPNNTLPLFKSRIPKVTGVRTFPDIAVILAGYPANPAPTMNGLKGETLSPVARVMKFRLTVRDNRAGGGGVVSSGGGGCQNSTPFEVNVGGTTPFSVTVPNGGESYFASSTQTVTWNNAATNGAPFNVANVKISISNDGGLTYPTVLLASTPNTGSASVTMPATTTTTARIKVEAIGNIFFDISNANFTLTVPPTDFNFGTTTATTSACPAAATLDVTIPTTQTGGFANPITLAATTGVPAGTTVSFGTNPVAPGSSSVATLNNANTLSAGTYVIGVSGTATGASVKNTTISFIITAGAGPVLTTNPVSASVCAPATANFTVATAAAGVTYQWQSAPSVAGTYTNVSTGTGGTTASYTTGATTAVMNGSVYRCIVSTQCGTTTSSVATLTVNTAAAITTQPLAQAACTGTNATFNVTATGTGVSYQWQSSTTGTAGSFTNVGTNSSSYTITGVTAATPTFYQVIVSTTTCPATVTSSVVQLTITSSVTVSNPVSVAACVGATANFSVTATGAGLTYQWQSAPTAAGTFANVSTGTGGTTASYTTAAATVGMNGSVYRVIVTGTCLPATPTTAGTLTVNTAAAVATNPIDSTVCSGITAGFTGSGTGTGVTYQWQQSASAAGPWVNAVAGAGATTGTYTTPVTTPTTPITYYRLAVITTTCPSTVYTTAAKLTVNTQAIINTQPTLPIAVCVTSTNVLTVNASYASNYQWQVSTAAVPTFTNIPTATSASFTIALPTVAMSGNKYRVLVFSTCTPGVPTISNELTLVVTPPVAVTQNPVATSGCVNVDRSFSVTATGATNYQWQFATSATGTYTDIPGATSATYTVINPSLVVNGYYYRVIVSSVNGLGICSSVTTPGAQLLVSVKPVLVLTQAVTSNTNAAVNSTLTTTVSPVGNYTYNWKRNGTSIANTLASTFISLNVDDAAIYIVTVTDPTTGCASDATADATKITSALTSDNLQNDKVFIYPNPVSSIMYVRFNTSTSASRGTTLNVYDEKGAKVVAKAFDIVNTNGRMAVDMSGLALGTYMVYIMDASGKKLGAAKVVKVQ